MRACPILIVPIVDFLDILYIRLCVKVNFANQFQSLVVRLAESKTETLIPKVANMGIFCRMPYPSQNYYFFRDFFRNNNGYWCIFLQGQYFIYNRRVIFIMYMSWYLVHKKLCQTHWKVYRLPLSYLKKKL